MNTIKLLILFFLTSITQAHNTSENLTYEIPLPTFKSENKINKKFLIKLNSEISNITCNPNISISKLNKISINLHKFLIHSLSNKSLNPTLMTIHAKWIEKINNCDNIKQIAFKDDISHNHFSALSNENYPKYLNLYLKFSDLIKMSNKYKFDFDYEFDICNSMKRSGYLSDSMSCMDKIIESAYFDELESNSKIKLQIEYSQLQFEIDGCQPSKQSSNLFKPNKALDIVKLFENIKHDICNNNLKNINDQITKLEALSQSSNFDMEYFIFYLKFSSSIVNSSFDTADSLLQTRLKKSESNIPENNFYSYLNVLLNLKKKNYNQANIELLKIIDYPQFAPILKIRINYLGCLISHELRTNYQRLCNTSFPFLKEHRRIDKKYMDMFETIKDFKAKMPAASNEKMNIYTPKQPGLIELFY